MLIPTTPHVHIKTQTHTYNNTHIRIYAYTNKCTHLYKRIYPIYINTYTYTHPLQT